MNAIQCPECKHEFSESEKLLCMIPGGHYCPQCWAMIPDEPDSPTGPADPNNDKPRFDYGDY